MINSRINLLLPKIPLGLAKNIKKKKNLFFSELMKKVTF